MYYESNLFCLRSPWGDRLLASLVIVLLTPVWMLNWLIAQIKSDAVLIDSASCDALGRWHFGAVFSSGVLRGSFIWWSVAQGQLPLLGLSRSHRIEYNGENKAQLDQEFRNQPAGVFSLYDLYMWVGLVEQSHLEVLRRQIVASDSCVKYYAMVAQIFCGWLVFGCLHLRESVLIHLFGVHLHNDSLSDALQWFAQPAKNKCRRVFFVNVNSLNIAHHSSDFTSVLNRADKLFADGSGVRLAAMRAGNRLRANLNGTDLLPHLCALWAANDQSIFLLGAEPGVADAAANQLQKNHSGLRIAGVHHGYFDNSQNEKLIARINQSGANILLVGFGSPLQEQWVEQNAEKLQCQYVLAVGGLFDFVAGKFSRAPLWLRSIGMEWLWRLLQDPATKFSRYVFGNPVFIYRLIFQFKTGE